MLSLFPPSFSVSVPMSNAWYNWIEKKTIPHPNNTSAPTPHTMCWLQSARFLQLFKWNNNETTCVFFFSPLFGQIKSDRSWKFCLDVTFSSVYEWCLSPDVRKSRWAAKASCWHGWKNYVWNHGPVWTSALSSFICILHACTHICS